MADDKTASIITLHQPKRARTPAERARAYRERKRANLPAVIPVPRPIASPVITLQAVTPRDASRFSAGSVLLTTAALGLGTVGVTMNGWFARSLGSSEVAGWLFLAIGVAADLVALSMPAVAARAWVRHRCATAALGWAVWAMTFVFAVTAGIGFASVNIADVTQTRASRVTPAVVTAQTALADAMTARDRECKGGVGRFCRDREAAVVDLRKALDGAMAGVAQTADPQADAAVRLVTWASRGAVMPTHDDFAMLRLLLLSLLPQIGGILLMIARR